MTSTKSCRADRQQLAAGYRHCARLTWRHGTTYYWGAALLSRPARRHVYAIYALCRIADDLVDVSGAAPAQIEARLGALAEDLYASVAGVPPSGPTMAAIANTVATLGLPREKFERFFTAMFADLEVGRYETWADLCGYMDGSAAVIGELMLPVLRPRSESAFGPARDLGVAFQLTNFLRDVAEDLDRGRIYLPQEDLRRFGVDVGAREVTASWRELMAFEIARNRALYARADAGIALLPTDSARCVRSARLLYSAILTRIERADFDVFSDRVRVPTWRKAAVALSARTGVGDPAALAG